MTFIFSILIANWLECIYLSITSMCSVTTCLKEMLGGLLTVINASSTNILRSVLGKDDDNKGSESSNMAAETVQITYGAKF